MRHLSTLLLLLHAALLLVPSFIIKVPKLVLNSATLTGVTCYICYLLPVFLLQPQVRSLIIQLVQALGIKRGLSLIWPTHAEGTASKENLHTKFTCVLPLCLHACTDLQGLAT